MPIKIRVLLDQSLVLKVHLFDRSLCALIGVIELLERLVVVLGGKQLLALDAQGLGDQERLMGDYAVKSQNGVQVVRGKEVPEGHLAPGRGDLRMVLRPASALLSGSCAGPRGRSAA